MVKKEEKLRILVVEDNPGDYRLLQEYLKEGFLGDSDITQAKTLAEALKATSAEKFDIILSDLGLPDSAGLDTLEKLFSHNPSVPIIVLTGFRDEEIGIKALEKNAQDYLVKGNIEKGLLTRSIRYAIERKRIENALYNERNNLRTLIDNIPGYVYFKDAQSRFITANSATSRIMKSKDPDTLIGKTDFDFYPKELASKFYTDEARIIKTGEAVLNIEESILDEDNQLKIISTSKVPLKDSRGKIIGLVGIGVDMTERKIKEKQLGRLNRTLKALNRSSKAMMYTTNEQAYLNEVCNIIVEDCGHAMSWIGFVENDKFKTVRAVAQAGFEKGYLKTLKVTWADTERGRGPTGTAIRTGKPAICSNILIDPNFKPWRREAIKRGYASSVVLPLINNSKVFGVLNIYSKETDPFSKEEVQLLTELADDLAYGIMAIRLRKEHQQMEDNLRQTRDYLESLFNYANAPIICWDTKFKITRFNHAFEHLSDYKAEEVIGRKLSMLFPEESKKESLLKIKRTLAGEYWEVVEIPIIRKDGQIRIALWNSANVYDKDSKTILATIAQGQDITERKKAEEELIKAHEELEEKVIERTSQLIKTNEQLSREIAERQNVEMEIRARNSLLRLAARAGSRKEYLDSVIKLFRLWSGASCVGIRLLSEDGRIPYESYLGFRREFWETENWLSVKKDKCACIRVITGEFVPEDSSVITPRGSFYCRNTTEMFSRLLQGKIGVPFRGNCLKEGFKSLVIIPIRFKNKVIGAIHIADKNKDVPAPRIVEHLESLAACVAEDIIKFNLSERIAKSNELLEKFFSSTNFHIAYMDVNFNFIRVNQAYAQMLNRAPDFFVGKNHFALFPNEENEHIFKKVVESAKDYTTFDRPFVYQGQPERGITYWDWSLQPLKDAQGKVEGLILFLVDTTKRKQAEDALIKAQMQLSEVKRLTDIGTLAATVAHELRNPLAAIQMASYNIKRKAQNPALEKHLSTIENKVNESEQIISNLLFYSRLKSPQHEEVKICEVMNECIMLAKKRFAKEKVSLIVNLSSIKNTSIDADPLQIKEVFCNILNNAYESQLKENKCVEIIAGVDKGSIKVTIKDSGEGIDKNDLERIFDPFFTTKARGTGLGLTVCKQIINLHGGSIGIESEKNKGTVVTVCLPVKKEKSS